MAEVPVEESPVTVYWRPGCGFCEHLFANLSSRGLVVNRRNIWDDAEAAAFVRSVANGNETVPTVQIGRHSLVNPSVDQISALLAQVMPDYSS